MRAKEGRAQSTAERRLAPATGTQRKPRNFELGRERWQEWGSARQQLLREVRIMGSMSFIPGFPSLGKQGRNANGHLTEWPPCLPQSPNSVDHTLL